MIHLDAVETTHRYVQWQPQSLCTLRQHTSFSHAGPVLWNKVSYDISTSQLKNSIQESPQNPSVYNAVLNFNFFCPVWHTCTMIIFCSTLPTFRVLFFFFFIIVICHCAVSGYLHVLCCRRRRRCCCKCFEPKQNGAVYLKSSLLFFSEIHWKRWWNLPPSQQLHC